MNGPREDTAGSGDKRAARHLRVAGTAVEDPSGLWHLNRDAAKTFCGSPCGEWPTIPDAAERFGIWCGACLARVSGMSE